MITNQPQTAPLSPAPGDPAKDSPGKAPATSPASHPADLPTRTPPLQADSPGGAPNGFSPISPSASPPSPPQVQTNSPGEERWQRELRRAVRSADELLRLCGLDEMASELRDAAQAQFPVMVPRGLLRRIKPGDPQDPILLQVLPQAREMSPAAGYAPDPLHEADFTPLPGLLHKYPSRVLLIAAGGCAVNCRYCFRRHFPYGEHRNRFDAWVSYLQEHREVREVILSGGDPLLCGDEQLARYLPRLQEIDHIDSLRIHSRIPVVLPERITPALLALLRRLRKPVTLVLHSNCAAEIDPSVSDALERLHRAGVTLLNQSVLLRGVNDSADALRDLSLALQRARVLPYYLFLLDAVQGSAHFEVPEATALALHGELCRRLPRYLVPRLARECAGEPHKRVLAG